MTDKEMVEKAKEAQNYSYSPYSKFRVGACLLCKDGSVYTGCNVENAAYGPSNCAERTAIFKAVSEGKRDFVKIAIIVDGDDYGYPCGVCRQVMGEFSPDMEVIMANNKGDFIKKNLRELLPYCFRL